MGMICDWVMRARFLCREDFASKIEAYSTAVSKENGWKAKQQEKTDIISLAESSNQGYSQFIGIDVT